MDLFRSSLDRFAAHFPGGPEGNRRLTALLGALLAFGIVVELATLALGLQHVLLVHVAVGVALVPLVAAKLAATGWRMLRYYSGNPGYRREGPPRPLLRALAPLLVLSTAGLLGSGVGLVLAGPHPPAILGALHGASFSLFIALVAVHALAHLPKLRSHAFADLAARLQGQRLRLGAAAGSAAIGIALAAAAAEQAEPLASALRHSVGG